MNTEVLTPLLDWLDLAGVAIFALTGALVAAKERQTFVTLAFFALVTGVGGGTVRDLLIGAPVFWIHDGGVAGVCLAVALFAWFIPTRWWAGRFLSIADGLGLAAYAVLGSAKALQYGVPPVPAERTTPGLCERVAGKRRARSRAREAARECRCGPRPSTHRAVARKLPQRPDRGLQRTREEQRGLYSLEIHAAPVYTSLLGGHARARGDGGGPA